MQPQNNIAFKEWAAVCHAIAAGEQTLIFRKGGIHEGTSGFRPEHSQFWLFPTKFHQSPDELVPHASQFATRPLPSVPEGHLPIWIHVEVLDISYVDDEAVLDTYRDQHILSQSTLHKRFHYRRPGLYLLKIRPHVLDQPHEIPLDPSYEGCLTWVPLLQSLSTRTSG